MQIIYSVIPERVALYNAYRKSPADRVMTSHGITDLRCPVLLGLLLAAASRGVVPEVGVVSDVIDTWISSSCSEARSRCDVDITCRVLLETIDKVCDQSGTIQHC